MYKSKMHNASETKQILENDSQDVMFKVYHKVKDRRDGSMNKHKQERMTLTKLSEQINKRFDNLESDVNSLKQDVNAINTRLDYVVQVNNLKDLAKEHK